MNTPVNNDFNKNYKVITFSREVTSNELLHTIFNYCVSFGKNILLHRELFERLSQKAVQIEPINGRNSFRIFGEFYTVRMGFVEYNSDFSWVDIICYSSGVAVRDPKNETLLLIMEE